jgi:hypothetical protein
MADGEKGHAMTSSQPQETARDYKLDACIIYSNANFSTPTPKILELEAVVKAFRYNLSRVRHLMLTPVNISATAMQLQRQFDVAALEVQGSLEDTDKSPLEAKPAIQERLTQLHNEGVLRQHALLGTKQWNSSVFKTHEIGAIAVNMLARAPFGTDGFDVLLSSLVIGAWSAFESMAGDLWEEALNQNPADLAQLKKGKNNNGPSKSVDLDIIQLHDFDLRKKMGTILRRRYEFSRLSSIRDAYNAAFNTSAHKIDAALKHDSLDALSIVRNVLVHNAGRADERYLGRAKSIQSLPKVALNELLPLDGEIVVGLIKPALIQGSNLLAAVDDWLHKHPSRPTDGERKT